MPKKNYNVIGLGGTFDHFHTGHAFFIDQAAELADELVIGITGPALHPETKTFGNLIEPLASRETAVNEYCQTKGYRCRTTVLTDIFGPTLSDSSIQALCVTPETHANGEQINQARVAQGLSSLPIHQAAFFIDQTGKPLHAAEIRAGRSSRTGIVYATLMNQTVQLTSEQKAFFATPQGPVLSSQDLLLVKDQAEHIAVVGDSTLEFFISNKLNYTLGIFDFMQQRVRVEPEVLKKIEPAISAVNSAGSISAHLSASLRVAIEQKLKHLFVDGEEDLATVALVLLLPLGSQIYYGQPQQGVVQLNVTEELKERFYHACSH